jgi:hypothetical protein
MNDKNLNKIMFPLVGGLRVIFSQAPEAGKNEEEL